MNTAWLISLGRMLCFVPFGEKFVFKVFFTKWLTSRNVFPKPYWYSSEGNEAHIKAYKRLFKHQKVWLQAHYRKKVDMQLTWYFPKSVSNSPPLKNTDTDFYTVYCIWSVYDLVFKTIKYYNKIYSKVTLFFFLSFQIHFGAKINQRSWMCINNYWATARRTDFCQSLMYC